NVGFMPTTIYGTVHRAAQNGRGRGGRVDGTAPLCDYHPHAIEWVPGRIHFFFDDQKNFTFTDDGRCGGHLALRRRPVLAPEPGHWWLLGRPAGRRSEPVPAQLPHRLRACVPAPMTPRGDEFLPLANLGNLVRDFLGATQGPVS